MTFQPSTGPRHADITYTGGSHLHAPRIYRQATPLEIICKYEHELRYDRPVRFRHFTVELYHHKSGNGVAHRDHSRARLHIVNGVPHVRHHGKLEPVTATFVDFGDNALLQWQLCDLRLDSKYLPAL